MLYRRIQTGKILQALIHKRISPSALLERANDQGRIKAAVGGGFPMRSVSEKTVYMNEMIDAQKNKKYNR